MINALLLALLFHGITGAADDDGGGAGATLKVSAKHVPARALLEHGFEFGVFDVALAMREPADAYRSVSEELQGVIKRNLKTNTIVGRVKLLKAFPADVEPAEIVDAIEEHKVRYLMLITLDPPERGDVPVILLELWNAKGKVQEHLQIKDALYWKEPGSAPSHLEAQDTFDRDAWKLGYEHSTTWRYTRGGYMPYTTSTAVVVDSNNAVLDDDQLQTGTSPDVSHNAAIANNLGVASLVFQLASWAVILGFPTCLGCLGGVVGLAVGSVAAIGSGVTTVGYGLAVGLGAGCLGGCVISFIALWPINLGQYGLNLVAYYFRKAFYYSAINEHNQRLSGESNVSLDDQPREYHPSSLFWD